mmetsp:Transcript_10559/g.11991  ORF Transcript_10559/g.11991 Transcript_10559/m.11991 type:complete len:85 (+) Transcript_10559:190-444(+)
MMITIIAVVVVFHTTQDWRLLPTAISSRWCDGMDDNNIIDFQISAQHKTNHDAPIIELYLPTLSVLMWILPLFPLLNGISPACS